MPNLGFQLNIKNFKLPSSVIYEHYEYNKIPEIPSEALGKITICSPYILPVQISRKNILIINISRELRTVYINM